MILYALEGVGACRNVLINLGIYAVSVCHIVVCVAGSPISSAKRLITYNGEGSNVFTYGTNIILVAVSLCSKNYGVALRAAGTGEYVIAVLCAGCRNRLGSIACGSVVTAVGIVIVCLDRPLATALCIEVISVYSAVKLNVNSLLRAVVEDNVGGVCGYGDRIDILAVIVSSNLFHSGTGPANSRSASPVVSIYLAPALVVGEVNGLCLCAGFIGCECRNSGKAHYHRKNENERKKNFSCVFHRYFLSCIC